MTRKQPIWRSSQFVISAAAMLLVGSCCFWQYRLSDARQLSQFRAHKAEYEVLLNMFQHDRLLTFINNGLTTPEDPSTVGISPQRISEYRRYMTAIGGDAVRYDSNSTLFVSDATGAADIFHTDATAAGARHIEGDWYLIPDYPM